MATQDFTINGKALYTTKGAAREYGRIGCNFYTGCPHDCTYCYLKRGAPSKYLGGKEVRLKKCFKDEIHAADILQLEMDRWIEPCRKYGIFLSFTTDPMLEETRYLTAAAIRGHTERHPSVGTDEGRHFHFRHCIIGVAGKHKSRRSSVHPFRLHAYRARRHGAKRQFQYGAHLNHVPTAAHGFQYMGKH